MNVAVKREIYAAMAEDYGQSLYIEAFFGTIRGECMTEFVKIMIFYFNRFEYFFVAVLHSTRFNDFI